MHTIIISINISTNMKRKNTNPWRSVDPPKYTYYTSNILTIRLELMSFISSTLEPKTLWNFRFRLFYHLKKLLQNHRVRFCIVDQCGPKSLMSYALSYLFWHSQFITSTVFTKPNLLAKLYLIIIFKHAQAIQTSQNDDLHIGIQCWHQRQH